MKELLWSGVHNHGVKQFCIFVHYLNLALNRGIGSLENFGTAPSMKNMQNMF